jgi:hypothetical protein
MVVRGFLARDKEGSSVAYSMVRKLEPDTVSRQKDRTDTENVFVRGYNIRYLFTTLFGRFGLQTCIVDLAKIGSRVTDLKDGNNK